jgi:hypothetical protein
MVPYKIICCVDWISKMVATKAKSNIGPYEKNILKLYISGLVYGV